MKYDIILITDGDVGLWQVRPLGPQRLAAELRKYGYSVKVIDFFKRWLKDLNEFNTLIDLLVDNNTLFIGFSGTFFNKIDTFDEIKNVKTYKDLYKTTELAAWPLPLPIMTNLLNNIKEKFPNIKFIYGGERYDYKVSEIENLIDFFIQGYADSTIIELANHLSKKTPLKYIPSKGKAKIVNYDINASNFNFKENSFVKIQESDQITEHDVLTLETSRGCMFQCSFCGYPILGRKKLDPDYHKTIDNISNELIHNWDLAKVNKYIMADSIFNETTEKLELLLKARDKSKVDIKFNAFTRYELIAKFPEQLKLLKDLGMQSTCVGIESLYHPSAKLTGKGTDPEKVKEILYTMRDSWNNSINISGSFIIGLPDDTEENLETWIPWIKSLDCPLNGLFVQGYRIDGFGYNKMNFDPSKYGYFNIRKIKNYLYWENKHWNSIKAERYVWNLMNDCWSSGRFKVCGTDIMGLQTAGYSFEDLLGKPMKDLDYQKISDNLTNKWLNYKNNVFKYENT